MGFNTNPLVLRTGVRATWLPGERFWYRVTTENGNEFMLVDPARGTRGPAFDHAKVAAALSTAAGTKYDRSPPFQQIDFSDHVPQSPARFRQRGIYDASPVGLLC